MTVSSLRDFDAGKSKYLSSHLFKGDAASISSMDNGTGTLLNGKG